jgi:aspartyl/asparaginyl-tRNA synthetase
MFGQPVMVYNWPQEVKAFYMKEDEEDKGYAKGVDLLAPEGYGEVVGGGETRDRHREIESRKSSNTTCRWKRLSGTWICVSLVIYLTLVLVSA